MPARQRIATCFSRIGSRSIRPRTRASVAALAATALCLVLGAALTDAAEPTLTVEPVTVHTITTAQVSGTIDATATEETSWCFEYTVAGHAEWTLAGETCGEAVPAGVSRKVEGRVTGLKAGESYEVRLLAQSPPGSESFFSGPSPLFTTDPAPDAPTLELPAPSPTTTSATLQGSVDPEGGNLEGPGEPVPIHWAIELCEEAAGCAPVNGSWSAVSEGDITAAAAEGTDPIDVPVAPVEASGLNPNTNYLYRLRATYAGLRVETDASRTFTTGQAEPTAFAGTNTPESQSAVLLRGAVNPRNSPVTDCHFAYGPAGGSEATAPCEGTIAGDAPVLVTARPAGLAPAAAGRFKVVITTSGGSAESEPAPFLTLGPEAPEDCPNQARREEQDPGGSPSTDLPDCRAYEMVSPADKNGGDVISAADQSQAAESGDALEFASLQAFGDAHGTGLAVEYISERDGTAGTSGWATHALFPIQNSLSLNAAATSKDTSYRELSPDLSTGILQTLTPETGDPAVAGVSNLYLRTDLLSAGEGSYRLLTACPACGTPLSDPLGQYNPAFAGASTDFGHVAFEATENLTSEAPPQPALCVQRGLNCRPRLYESDNGTPRLVGLIPPEGQIECGASGPTCEAAARSIAGQNFTQKRFENRIVSGDGSRVTFVVPAENTDESGGLYLRTDDGRPDAGTVQVNASERTDCAGDPSCGGDGIPDPAPDPAGPLPATFQTASADGTKIFFTTAEKLTDDDNNGDVDLYMYDASLPASDPHNLTRISVDSQPGDGPSAPLIGVIGASQDGDTVYFAAEGQLVAGGPALDGAAPAGIYAWHEGRLTFLGGISKFSETEDVLGGQNIGRIAARVTPDGDNLLFTSNTGAGLTGYDHGATCGPSGGAACTEIYLYDLPTDTLRCVSCDPGGAPASADATFTVDLGNGSSTNRRLDHAVSDDGRRVFFETAQPLVAADTDGVDDVYEYDATSGSLRLISPGTSPAEAHFLDASPSGDDVFFTTSQQLLGWDVDGAYDVYDARSGGGLPEPPPSPAACAGEGCQGSPASGPLPGPGAATATFSGPPDPAPGHRRRPRRRHRHRHHHEDRHGHRRSRRAAVHRHGADR